MKFVFVSFITFFSLIISGFRPVYAETSYGTLWELPLSGDLNQFAYRSTPIIDSDDNIYVATTKQVVSATPQGTKRWERSTDNAYPQLALSNGKVVVIDGKKVKTLSSSNGDLLWESTISTDNFTITAAPQTLGDKVYITYTKTSPSSTYFKALKLESGTVAKEVSMSTESPYGLVTKDFAIPHLSSSVAYLFAPTTQKGLIAISREQLSIMADQISANYNYTYPVFDNDDNYLYYGIGNNFVKDKIKTDGHLYSASRLEWTIDLGAPLKAKPVITDWLMFVVVGGDNAPLKVKAYSKDSGREVWETQLTSSLGLPIVTFSDNLLAIVSNKLTILDGFDGHIINEVDLGNLPGNYFTSAVASGDHVVFVNKDRKLVAYGKIPPKHNPAIFIHGLGGNPSDWDSGNKAGFKTKLLAKYRTDDPSFSENWLVSYSYTGTDAKTGGYNNQGRIEDIALGMEQAIASVSAQHKAAGGDGKVDLVGFSLGGLVIREYLATHPDNNLARKCITIGTPHQGSFIADIKRNVDKLDLGKDVSVALYKSVEDAATSLGLSTDPDAETIPYLYTDSEYLSQLKSRQVAKPPIFDTIAGDMSIQLSQRYLYYDIKSSLIDIGDLVVSKESASTITPLGQTNRWVFREDYPIPIPVSFFKAPTPGLGINFPRIAALRFFHLLLPEQEEVQNQVVNELYGIPEDDIRHG